MDRQGWQKTVVRRLVISFLFIMLPLYVLGIVMYRTGMNTLRDEISASMEAQVSFYLGSIEGEVRRIRKLQLELINDRDISQLSSIPESLDNIERMMSMLRIQNRLHALQSSSDYISSVSVLIPSIGRELTSSTVKEPAPSRLGELEAGIPEDGRSIVYGARDILMVSRYPPPSISAAKSASFFIIVALSREELARGLAIMCRESGSRALLSAAGLRIAEAGTAMAAASGAKAAGELEDESGRVRIGGRPYLRVSKNSEYLGASLSKAMPEDVLFGSLRAYRSWFVILVLAGLVIILAYSASVYRFIHKPLSRLVESFKRVERGDFDVHIDHAGNDEFGYIYRQFNLMVSNLKELIDQSYEQKLLVQRAEMRQLQSQINPHFLYNSFFILNTMIRTDDREGLEALTDQLGTYFRFIAKGGSDFVSLEEEVGHARAYAEIQAMRFARRVRLDFGALPEGLEGILVPRLIVQPMIENAFEHGLGSGGRPGLVRVAFERETGFLRISVENSGETMDAGAIEGIRTRVLGNGEGESALSNIHKRLRLRFGGSSGIEVEAGSSGGIKVVASIEIGEGTSCIEC
jgi:Predicted signal transduction protein with a C-terminal ATPase domain